MDKRIDVLAVAIQAGMTVFDLEEMELAYAPQYGSAKDPINMAGFVAAECCGATIPRSMSKRSWRLLPPSALSCWTFARRRNLLPATSLEP